MQLKVGNVVKTADGGVGVLKFLGENFAKVEHSDGHETLEMRRDISPANFSKSGERVRDPKAAANVFGGSTVRATEAENFFRFPLDTRIEVRPTEDTGAEVDPRMIGKKGNVVTHHKGRIGVRLEGRTRDDFFKPEHLHPIER